MCNKSPHISCTAILISVVLTGTLLLTGCGDHQPVNTKHDPSAQELSLALAAKILCSDIFVAGRERGEALENSVLPSVLGPGETLKEPPFAPEDLVVDVNKEAGTVRTTLKSLNIWRTAKYYGDQGCIIHPRDHNGIFFTPVEVENEKNHNPDVLWPAGEKVELASLPVGVDAETLKGALELAFKSGNHTAAFLVVYNGRIIAERYDAGADKDMLLTGWSMGKSLTATLLGVAMQSKQEEDLFQPAPIAEWHQQPGDPRSSITIADLLRMSSGLKLSSSDDPADSWEHAHPDHIYFYSGAIDVFDFAASRPPEHPPGTIGRYRNSDPLLIGYTVKNMIGEDEQNYLRFPQSALFDRVGIHKFIMEPDPHGNFVSCGYEYGRPRDWARLGLLYLQKGNWNGEQILPEWFVDFVSTPAPIWEPPDYGGLFWINNRKSWLSMTALPENTYQMAGAGGQHVIIVPDYDLVIVRMGHMKGWIYRIEEFYKDLNAAVTMLVSALPVE